MTSGSAPAGITGSFWHTGVVVPDLEAAQAELTAATGATWRPWQERPDGDRTLRVSFSETQPYIELIEGNPDGVWDTAAGPHLHHLAYWTDDFDGECANLAGLELDSEIGGRSNWGGNWAYYRLPYAGVRIELCDTKGRDLFLERWDFPT